MFEYHCQNCDCIFESEMPLEEDARKICFDCEFEEIELSMIKWGRK